MGNLMQVLKKDAKRCGEDIFLDFENAQPTEEERHVYDEVKAVLDQSGAILEDLENYSGADEAIRLAIANPTSEDHQKQAWDAVCPLVRKLKQFYDFSSTLEGVLPMLLEALCAEHPVQSLERKQALAKQFAEILHFVLKFDDLKMSNPSIQNDFSYYRRTLSRMKMNNTGGEDQAVVTNEEANRMSLFYAYPTPILKTISDATTKFVSENKDIPIDNTTDCLSTMAAICRTMIEQPELSARFHNPETILFCQRVMVGVIILYDHVHLIGAFSKKNNSIDIRASIKVLKLHDNPHLEGLLNALRYTTKHLNDESTPKEVKKLLAA
eukprot:m.13473 g.13473  ORF g.13473 m.13473 type:complete len:325 (+) comp7282_c0_seq1:231-1205(+)